jgi:sortase (surface protein transpeptidase)
MRLPTILEGVPRIAYILAIPLVAFIVTVGIVLGTSSGGNEDNTKNVAALPTVKLSVDNIDAPAATATPKPQATATSVPEPNRKDCNAIRGTAYQSGSERDWYLANCTGATANTATTNSGGGGGGGGGGGTTTTAGGHTYGTEYALGAQLIIPSINLNASVTGMDVGANGAMPDPNGYFNVVQYNFPNHPGMGGTNKVIAGHVDCAHCYSGGGSGTAVFWYIRQLSVGASAQYVNPDGSVTNYVVVNAYAVPDGTDFSGVVASGSADMTLITCTGTFSSGSYNNRYIVQLKKA